MLMPENIFADEATVYGYLHEGKVRIVDEGYEAAAIRKDNTMFPVEFTVSEIWVGGQNSYVITLMDITDRKRLEAFLHEQALHDGLTGLYNKRAMETFLEEETERSLRYGHSFTLLMLDIDYFKAVNDTHGHQAGDTSLKEMSGLIQKNLRLTDKAFRYGGEEIVIMLAETRLDNAMIFAERLRSAIESNPFLVEDNNGRKIRIGITVSMGAAGFPENGESAEGLIAAADKALYEAKRGGRNNIVLLKEG
jgi:diguanylate cyclase (GGDEF)-like protein